MKIKTETQARKFVAEALFEMFEKCQRRSLNQEFYGELAFYILGSLILNGSGKENFEELIEQIRENKKPKRARRKS